MVEVSVAKEPTADAPARAFLAQQGLTSGYPVRTSIGGLPAVTAGFAAATDNGTLRGTVLLVEYGGAVYPLGGSAPDPPWAPRPVAPGPAPPSLPPPTPPPARPVPPPRAGIQ